MTTKRICRFIAHATLKYPDKTWPVALTILLSLWIELSIIIDPRLIFFRVWKNEIKEEDIHLPWLFKSFLKFNIISHFGRVGMWISGLSIFLIVIFLLLIFIKVSRFGAQRQKTRDSPIIHLNFLDRFSSFLLYNYDCLFLCLIWLQFETLICKQKYETVNNLNEVGASGFLQDIGKRDGLDLNKEELVWVTEVGINPTVQCFGVTHIIFFAFTLLSTGLNLFCRFVNNWLVKTWPNPLISVSKFGFSDAVHSSTIIMILIVKTFSLNLETSSTQIRIHQFFYLALILSGLSSIVTFFWPLYSVPYLNALSSMKSTAVFVTSLLFIVSGSTTPNSSSESLLSEGQLFLALLSPPFLVGYLAFKSGKLSLLHRRLPSEVNSADFKTCQYLYECLKFSREALSSKSSRLEAKSVLNQMYEYLVFQIRSQTIKKAEEQFRSQMLERKKRKTKLDLSSRDEKAEESTRKDVKKLDTKDDPQSSRNPGEIEVNLNVEEEELFKSKSPPAPIEPNYTQVKLEAALNQKSLSNDKNNGSLDQTVLQLPTASLKKGGDYCLFDEIMLDSFTKKMIDPVESIITGIDMLLRDKIESALSLNKTTQGDYLFSYLGLYTLLNTVFTSKLTVASYTIKNAAEKLLFGQSDKRSQRFFAFSFLKKKDSSQENKKLGFFHGVAITILLEILKIKVSQYLDHPYDTDSRQFSFDFSEAVDTRTSYSTHRGNYFKFIETMNSFESIKKEIKLLFRVKKQFAKDLLEKGADFKVIFKQSVKFTKSHNFIYKTFQELLSFVPSGYTPFTICYATYMEVVMQSVIESKRLLRDIVSKKFMGNCDLIIEAKVPSANEVGMLEVCLEKDDYHKVVSMSANVTKLLGYSPEELSGNCLSTMIPDPLRSSHKTLIHPMNIQGEYLNTNNTLSIPFVCKSGLLKNYKTWFVLNHNISKGLRAIAFYTPAPAPLDVKRIIIGEEGEILESDDHNKSLFQKGENIETYSSALANHLAELVELQKYLLSHPVPTPESLFNFPKLFSLYHAYFRLLSGRNCILTINEMVITGQVRLQVLMIPRIQTFIRTLEIKLGSQENELMEESLQDEGLPSLEKLMAIPISPQEVEIYKLISSVSEKFSLNVGLEYENKLMVRTKQANECKLVLELTGKYVLETLFKKKNLSESSEMTSRQSNGGSPSPNRAHIKRTRMKKMSGKQLNLVRQISRLTSQENPSNEESVVSNSKLYQNLRIYFKKFLKMRHDGKPNTSVFQHGRLLFLTVICVVGLLAQILLGYHKFYVEMQVSIELNNKLKMGHVTCWNQYYAQSFLDRVDISLAYQRKQIPADYFKDYTNQTIYEMVDGLKQDFTFGLLPNFLRLLDLTENLYYYRDEFPDLHNMLGPKIDIYILKPREEVEKLDPAEPANFWISYQGSQMEMVKKVEPIYDKYIRKKEQDEAPMKNGVRYNDLVIETFRKNLGGAYLDMAIRRVAACDKYIQKISKIPIYWMNMSLLGAIVIASLILHFFLVFVWTTKKTYSDLLKKVFSIQVNFL